MNIKNALTLLLLALCVTDSLAKTTAPSVSEQPIYIYGTINGLLEGAFDGEKSIQDLKKAGNMGLGTFNRLDGGLIMLDGIVYQSHANGSVSIASPKQKTPFAHIAQFKPQEIFPIQQVESLSQISKLLDAHLPNKNLFYSAQVSGEFSLVSTRSIPPQTKPYKSLANASKEQVVSDKNHFSGVLVGMRTPYFARGISVSGWHWHFISDDHTFAGHVLNASIKQGTVKISPHASFRLEIPQNEDFKKTLQNKDQTVLVKKIEGNQDNSTH